MRALASAGCGFLLAVLWFDLMFDVQCRGHRDTVLPATVRDAIAAYYRRVTTAARPMNRLVAVAMLTTIAPLIAEAIRGDVTPWVAWTSLGLVTGAVGLAGSRTVPSAVRLGGQSDEAATQSVLARRILRDHIVCFVAVSIALVLQLAVHGG